MKVVNIVGARPNFVKIAPLMQAMVNSSIIDPILLHTGQHYDYNMSESFFLELEIPEPDVYLNVGSDTHGKQVAKIMKEFDDFCDAQVHSIPRQLSGSILSVRCSVRVSQWDLARVVTGAREARSD